MQQPNQKDQKAVVAAFKRQKRRRMVAILVCFLGLALRRPGIPSVLDLLLLGVLGAALLVWLLDWRCPACGRYLGFAENWWSVWRCKRCDAQLTD